MDADDDEEVSMINVELRGGLCNQAFQYACGRSLELRGFEVTYSLVGLSESADEIPHHTNTPQYGLDRFNTKITIGSKNRHASTVSDHDMKFNRRAAQGVDPGNYNGYWQNLKYFIDVADEIRNDFTLRQPPPANVLKLADQISTSEGVFIHVRRGDYASIPGNEEYHGTMKMSYYEKALGLITYAGKGIPDIYVFSDDIKWCAANFVNYPAYFVETGSRFHDLYLMSKAKHAIIANSSYSWFGAFLGAAKTGMVIAPKQWFTTPKLQDCEIIPDSWVKI